MEYKIKDYKNKILAEIHTIENCIDFDENMINNLKHQGVSLFVTSQIEKVTIKNDYRQKTITELYEKIKDVDSGKMNEEILNITVQDTLQHKIDEKAAKQKKIDKAELKKVDSVKSQKYYKSMLQSDREQRYHKKDANRSFFYYQKICDSIPDYISRNLKEMPNNKGYIWRGIRCYGHLPEENRKIVTLFEKQRGGLLIIHEISKYEYKIFHKKGRDRKTLYSVEQRKQLS